MLLRFINKIGRIYHRIATYVLKWRLVRYIKFWHQFYHMRRLGVPVLTLRMASRRGILDIYHLNKGVGDALMFSGIAREYYKKTNIRPLIYVPQWPVFQNCNFCWYLMDWKMVPENIPGIKNTMEVFYKFYIDQQKGKHFKLRNGHVFNLKPLEYLKNGYVWGNTFVKLFAGFPKRGQICQWIGNRMGITGEIDVRPEIILTDAEKEFGKFAAGKIVIKCGGNGPYKYLTHKIAQGIVDEFKGQYQFIQVGDFSDPVINGAENMFKLNLREFAGILHHARLFVGAIGGMMHLARAMNCPAVILHGCEHDDFYFPSQRKVFSEKRCLFCVHNCWWPDKDDERRCPFRYRCITDFNPKRIAGVMREELNKPRELAAIPDTFKCVGHVADCNSAMNWWLTFDDLIMDFEIPKSSDECLVSVISKEFDYQTKKSDDYILGQSLPISGDCDTDFFVQHYHNEIYSDNPFVIRLKPRPSYFAYIAKIADMQLKWTKEWHKKEPVDDSSYWKNESSPKPEYVTFEGFARANHMMNFFLWHTEDIARRRDVPDSVLVEAKRNIDHYNQLRNDFAESMDETMVLVMRPSLPGALKAPFNTESLGMILDRLSILALKIYHMEEAIKKNKEREKSKQKLQTLQAQRYELLESTKFLLVDFLNGARQPLTYYQFKMYNNPKLNPQLAGK